MAALLEKQGLGSRVLSQLGAESWTQTISKKMK
jgi:hypothetical protein